MPTFPNCSGSGAGLEWRERMAKMAYDILLAVAEQGGEEPDLCAMAAAKLHALVQTRTHSSAEENSYLIYRWVHNIFQPRNIDRTLFISKNTENLILTSLKVNLPNILFLIYQKLYSWL